MIYLVLDTNVWFYLANAFNSSKKKFDDGLHFKLVLILKRLVANGDISILTNPIIIEEWGRNKEVANRLISKHKKTLEGHRGTIKNIGKYIEKDQRLLLNDIFNNYEDQIKKVISDNKNHILEVEDLLLNKTQKIEITNEIKLIAANRAIKKLAPFKGDKSNSMADALILLSSIDYIKKISVFPVSIVDKEASLFPNSIFVTINKNDFGNPNNENEIHPELRYLLEEVKMKYEPNVGTVINQVEDDLFKQEEIKQIEREMEAEYWRNIAYCTVCFPDPEKTFIQNIVDFSEPIYIENEMREPEDPNQLKLLKIDPIEVSNYKENKNKRDIDTVQIGYCNCCNSQHIKCQYCGTVSNVEECLDGDKLQCEGCETSYQIRYQSIGNGMQELEFKIVDDGSE